MKHPCDTCPNDDVVTCRLCQEPQKYSNSARTPGSIADYSSEVVGRFAKDGTDGLRRSAKAIYIAAEKPVADDISARLIWAAEMIDTLKAELRLRERGSDGSSF